MKNALWLAALAALAFSQPPAASRPQGGKLPAPRLEDGKPDLSGPWISVATRESISLLAASVDIPFKPQAKALYDARVASLGKDDPERACLPLGVPRLTTAPYPFRFLQVRGLIAILYESSPQAFRQIFMDGRKHSTLAVDLWNGESIGRWEGDTLVIETAGFNDRTWIDAAGVPHGQGMKVTESITRTDMDTMETVIMVDDPEYYTKPWGFTIHAKRQTGDLVESICESDHQ